MDILHSGKESIIKDSKSKKFSFKFLNFDLFALTKRLNQLYLCFNYKNGN